MSSTSRGRARENLDFYPTPAWAVDLILDRLNVGHGWQCLEPAAGDGAIVKRLLARGYPAEQIDAIEIDQGRAEIVRGLGVSTMCADFTVLSGVHPYSLIITNPPFALAEGFARRMIAMTSGGGTAPDEPLEVVPTAEETERIRRLLPTLEAQYYPRAAAAMRPREPRPAPSSEGGTAALLLRLNWLGSQERSAFHRAHPADIYLLPKRPEFTASMSCSAKKAGCEYKETLPIEAPRPRACPLCGARTSCSTTDSIEYAWFVWGPGHGGRWEILPMPAG